MEAPVKREIASLRSQRHQGFMTDLKPARILAIETSCDETACAII